MQKIIKRNPLKNIFLNPEKEEQWLNQMSKKGLNLVSISKRHYIFEESTANEYQYKIDFLDTNTNTFNKDEYIDLFKELDIEVISSINRFLYLRRKASTDSFSIYSDNTSKINYYKRINGIYYILAVLSLFSGIHSLTSSSNFLFIITLGLLYIFISIYFITLAIPLQKIINRLIKENTMHE